MQMESTMSPLPSNKLEVAEPASNYSSENLEYNANYRIDGGGDISCPVIVFINEINTDMHIWDPVISILKEKEPPMLLISYSMSLIICSS
jgi:hypothetical protein